VKPEILLDSENFLAVNKPSRMHSVQGKSKEISVQDWLAANFSELKTLPDSGLLHRLDFETTGVLLAARKPEVYQEWSQKFRTSGDLKKIYWAITSHEPQQTEFDLYFYSRYRGSKKTSVRTSGKTSERGRCRWRSLDKQGDRVLLEVELLGGGLRHQIRAGLAFLGCPLDGDILYGGRPKSYFGLHARELHWANQRVIAPPPQDWEALFI
jgi:23S rRNA-/tRNA-specific pseudouridylate synthase